MKKDGIIINDLHMLTKTFAADQFDGPGNVHYTQEGYQKIGQQVTDHILTALEGKQQEPGDTELLRHFSRQAERRITNKMLLVEFTLRWRLLGTTRHELTNGIAD